MRTTLDPKMQMMARKAMVDGLVRFDEAHGYRGPVKQIDIGSDWGQALGRRSGAWRCRALAPRRGPRRQRRQSRGSACSRRAKNPATFRRDRETGVITADGVRLACASACGRRSRPATWSMSSRSKASKASSGCARFRKSPAPCGDGPLYRPRLRDGRRLLLRPVRRSTARRRRCASPVRPSSPSSMQRRSITATRPPPSSSTSRSKSMQGRMAASGSRKTTAAILRPAHAALRHRAFAQRDDRAPRPRHRHAADRRIRQAVRRL